MKIVNTGDKASIKQPVLMLLYGQGGIGKTTFAATAPMPLILDCEQGTNYLGQRSIAVDTVQITEWAKWKTAQNQNPDQTGTMRDPELIQTISRSEKYQTIVVDSIGACMDKLIDSIASHPDSKLRNLDGSPTIAGWSYAKNTMSDFIKYLSNTGKHVLLVANIEEKMDENGCLIKRPLIATKIGPTLVSMVNIVGFLTAREIGSQSKRVVIVDGMMAKTTAKDRTNQLGLECEPDFSQIIKTIYGKK